MFYYSYLFCLRHSELATLTLTLNLMRSRWVQDKEMARGCEADQTKHFQTYSKFKYKFGHCFKSSYCNYEQQFWISEFSNLLVGKVRLSPKQSKAMQSKAKAVLGPTTYSLSSLNRTTGVNASYWATWVDSPFWNSIFFLYTKFNIHSDKL